MDRSKLVEVTLFAALTDSELDRVLDESSSLDLVRGDVLFKEDEEADALFVVESGRVAIGNRSIDGRESMVALMESGDLFGEMSLFDGTGRSADARALEPSQVLSVPFEPLRTVLDERPSLLWEVVKMLSGRLRHMDAALADAFFLDVTGRTAKRLLELAGDTDAFEIPITQEELAGLIGASRERVNKAISAFMRLGWIEQHDRSYVILKRRELEIRAR